jgi:hypothetical protein
MLMYREHNPQIAAFMRESPENFRRGVMFAVLSIRQPITFVPEAMDDIETRGLSSRFLWGHKVAAFEYLETHAETLWHNILAAKTEAAAIEALLHVPGLGIVKAAFVCQLMGMDVACLDSRNVKREKRAPRAFRTDGKPPHKLRAKVGRYLKETRGKSERYWNEWCKDVARVYNLTPHEVSALHLSICQRKQFELEETF